MCVAARRDVSKLERHGFRHGRMMHRASGLDVLCMYMGYAMSTMKPLRSFRIDMISCLIHLCGRPQYYPALADSLCFDNVTVPCFPSLPFCRLFAYVTVTLAVKEPEELFNALSSLTSIPTPKYFVAVLCTMASLSSKEKAAVCNASFLLLCYSLNSVVGEKWQLRVSVPKRSWLRRQILTQHHGRTWTFRSCLSFQAWQHDYGGEHRSQTNES